MPSSMIFVGLVVVWLLILVPAVARHRQEVARPSTAALSGRVLERARPRRDPEPGRELEVDVMERVDHARPAAATSTTGGTSGWTRIPPTGPASGTTCTTMTSTMTTAARTIATSVAGSGRRRATVPAAAGSTRRPRRSPPGPATGSGSAWCSRCWCSRSAPRWSRCSSCPGSGGCTPPSTWPSSDTSPTSAARCAWRSRSGNGAPVGWPAPDGRRTVTGPRGPPTTRTASPARGRTSVTATVATMGTSRGPTRPSTTPTPIAAAIVDGDLDDVAADRDRPERAADQRDDERAIPSDDAEQPEPAERGPALPRLQPAPPPPLPAGTSLVEVDEADPELHDLDGPSRRDYRRAAGE